MITIRFGSRTFHVAAPTRSTGPRSLGLLVVATLALAAAESGQAQSAAARFRRIEGGPLKVDAARLASQRADRPVKLMVVMSEPSIAEARAVSATGALTDPERDGVRERVRAQHGWVRPHLDGQGARVLGEFHGALNGIEIEVRPSKVADISALPGVVGVLPVARHHRANVESVPYIGAPAVWQAVPGLRGEGVKVAVIDTGIDYTHANFGGPGTVAAFKAAAAGSAGPADPALFGPAAPKVKGGIDLAGDAYNADDAATSTPAPDANPLDCEGHGSHVAGTVAGFGVTAGGTTYKGPYTAAAYSPGAFSIGPGVAPKADLYAVRVFGCTGSTDLTVDAIEWAVNNGMDVISMSLGSDFGSAKTADALAATNAVRAGIIVVAASGNAGPGAYIASTPASGDGVIGVAAIDSRASFPGATLTLTGGRQISAQDSNGAPLPASALDVVVLRNADGSVSLGCDPAEYVAAGVAGKLAVAVRGTCARTDRAVNGQKAGAAAVVMINNAPGYPLFEGPIAGVTIPFFGITPADAATLTAAARVTAFAPVTLANPNLALAADFSSAGPRFGDSALRPSVAAPGVSIFSTLSGSGNAASAESGTSMATPHVAGVAALVRQAHPGWKERALAAAIVETASPGALLDYAPRLEGNGLVQPLAATQTRAVVFVDDDRGATAISFGFAEFTRDYSDSRTLRVINKGRDPILFNVAAAPGAGTAHKVTLGASSLWVRGGDEATLKVSVAIDAAAVGGSHDDTGNAVFRDAGGLVTLTPATPAMNNGVALRLPYYLVHRARSQVTADLTGDAGGRTPNLAVRLANRAPVIAGAADFYVLGLVGTRQGAAPFDVRAVGVQAFPSGTDSQLVFAINTFGRISNAAAGAFDILVDTDGDGTPDFDIFTFDFGALTTGSNSGDTAVAVQNLKTNDVNLVSLADAPTDGSIVLAPVLASDIGLSPSKSKFSYTATFANLIDSTSGTVPGSASFDAFTPAVSNGDFVPLAPGARASVPIRIDRAQWAKTPARGLMIVGEDNAAGAAQATLLPISLGR